MNFKKLSVFLLVFCTLFIFVFLKPIPFGFDTPYFFGLSCGWDVEKSAVAPLALFFFESLPCNLGFFKLVGLVLTLLCLFIVWQSGELIDKKFGWLAALFSVVMHGFVLTLFFFEDDLLALPFLFFSNYLMLRGWVLKEKAPKWVALGLVLFVGLFLWRGAWLYLFGYSFFFLPSAIMLLISTIFIGFDTIIGNLFPNFGAIENWPLIGLATLSFGWIGLAIFLLEGVWLGLPFLFLAALNSKFVIHFGFWLALGFVSLARYINFHPRFQEKFGNDFTVNLNRFLPFYCFAIAIGLGINVLFFQPPLGYQVNAVKDTILVSNSLNFPIQNDWSYGYLIRFFGGVPSREGGGGFDGFAEEQLESVVLTERPVDCFLIKEYGPGFVDNSVLRLYIC